MFRAFKFGSQLNADPKSVTDIVRKFQLPLNSSKDLDALLDSIGDSKYVLLGEATHGTSEFYQWRAAISRRLIEEKGFNFIAVEGDWPDCYEVNKYVKGLQGDRTISDVLINSFRRWPTWMWSNWEIKDLMEWLKSYNTNLQEGNQVGFYGLDVYSLYESMECMKKFVRDMNDPEATEAVQDVFRCFQPFAKDPIKYGYATMRKGFSEGCSKEVIKLLYQMRQKYDKMSTGESKNVKKEEAFSAEMNSKVLVDAENYYKIMLTSDASSWNVRDDHMADTLDSLMKFHGPDAKCIVWAHNTHIGDARYTDMIDSGERNLGQIVRQRHENEGVFLCGFGMTEGSVIAGDAWDEPPEKKKAPSAPTDSWEYLIKQADSEKIPNKLLLFDHLKQDERKIFEEMRGHRAIGVVYHPAHDRFGHWVPTALAKRYDAFIYLDKTMALHPLPEKVDHSLQPPITYPFGILK